MPSEFPGSPRLLKGALVVYESQTATTTPQVIVFQYNPEQVSRSLEVRSDPPESGDVGSAQEDILRVFGPPEERYTLSIVLDAADYLESPEQNEAVAEKGLFPILSVLEMMLYPPTFRITQNETLAEQGEVQLTPEDLPLVMLVFGEDRVAPVQLTNFSITEEAFDPRLNPIRAKVDLGLRVLTWIELPQDSQGRQAYLTYQRRKEEMAARYVSGEEADAIVELLE